MTQRGISLSLGFRKFENLAVVTEEPDNTRPDEAVHAHVNVVMQRYGVSKV